MDRDRIRQIAPVVGALWLKGKSQVEIAFRHDLSVRQVRRIIAYLRKLWRDRNERDIPERIDKELARIDLVESEAWEEWERSKRDSVTRARKIEHGGKDGLKRGRTKTVVGQCGDPRYLQLALDCIDKRLRLMGAFLKPSQEEQQLDAQQASGVLVVVRSPEQAQQILEYDEYQSAVVEGQVIAEEDERAALESSASDGLEEFEELDIDDDEEGGQDDSDTSSS